MSDPFDAVFDPTTDVKGDNDPKVDPAATVVPFDLTDEEKKKVLAAWNSGLTKLKEIVTYACGPGFDGRSKKGMAVRDYLASRQLVPVAAQDYTKRDEIKLTDAQKQSIFSMAPTAKPLEITRSIFDNPALSSLSAEFRVVKAVYDSLDPKQRLVNEEPMKDYQPPKTEAQAFARINKYVLEGIDLAQVTPKQKEYAAKLIKFMHTHRFLEELGYLLNEREVKTFESVFVRFVWDKPDLTEEEIDLYISYGLGVIASQRMQKELNDMCKLREELVEQENRFPQALLEAIGTLRGDINANEKRQKDMLQDLNGKRKDRLDKLEGDNGNILRLVEAFRDARKRERMLQVIEARKESLKEEATRLASIDDLHFELFGAGQKELT